MSSWGWRILAVFTLVALGLAITFTLDGHTAFAVIWLVITAAWGFFASVLWRRHLAWDMSYVPPRQEVAAHQEGLARGAALFRRRLTLAGFTLAGFTLVASRRGLSGRPHTARPRARPHADGGPPACPDAETDTDETVGSSSSQVLPGVRFIFAPFGTTKIAGWDREGRPHVPFSSNPSRNT